MSPTNTTTETTADTVHPAKPFHAGDKLEGSLDGLLGAMAVCLIVICAAVTAALLFVAPGPIVLINGAITLVLLIGFLLASRAVRRANKRTALQLATDYFIWGSWLDATYGLRLTDQQAQELLGKYTWAYTTQGPVPQPKRALTWGFTTVAEGGQVRRIALYGDATAGYYIAGQLPNGTYEPLPVLTPKTA